MNLNNFAYIKNCFINIITTKTNENMNINLIKFESFPTKNGNIPTTHLVSPFSYDPSIINAIAINNSIIPKNDKLRDMFIIYIR